MAGSTVISLECTPPPPTRLSSLTAFCRISSSSRSSILTSSAGNTTPWPSSLPSCCKTSTSERWRAFSRAALVVSILTSGVKLPGRKPSGCGSVLSAPSPVCCPPIRTTSYTACATAPSAHMPNVHTRVSTPACRHGDPAHRRDTAPPPASGDIVCARSAPAGAGYHNCSGAYARHTPGPASRPTLPGTPHPGHPRCLPATGLPPVNGGGLKRNVHFPHPTTQRIVKIIRMGGTVAIIPAQGTAVVAQAVPAVISVAVHLCSWPCRLSPPDCRTHRSGK